MYELLKEISWKILQRTKTNQQRISHSGQKQHMDAFIMENV